jgi:hypothetical protein
VPSKVTVKSPHFGHINVFDVPIPNEGLAVSAPIYLYHDEIAASIGMPLEQFDDLPKARKLQHAGRWLAKRRLASVEALHTRLEMRSNG